MANVINATSTGNGGLVSTGDDSGILNIQTNETTAITVDASQNATFAQAIKLSYSANSNYATDGALSNYASGNGVYLNGNAAGWLRLSGDGTNASYVQVTGSSSSSPNQVQFIAGGSQRATIASGGSFLVNTTQSGGWSTDGVFVSKTSSASLAWAVSAWNDRTSDGGAMLVRVDNTSRQLILFHYTASTAVGSITTNGTGVTYGTSSDYRLKENIAPMTGALAKVSLLKPVTYKWKSNGSDGQGFIAHELAEVVPDCVQGEKDAVDADGKPVYQGIDTSFLVATLTAALQETKALIDTQAATINALTARIVALETA
jgi:hypothetical protein